ncbi:MAG: PHP domain-containing protein [Candidatus Aenigmatarchaeota archaeon]
MIDLHIHTCFSDGRLTPEQVVDLAIASGLSAIAITDHDVINGIEPALDYAKNKNIKIVPGIEISCDENELGYNEVHVIGLFIDYKNHELMKFCEEIKKQRIEQKKKIIKNLQTIGFNITYEEVEKTVGASFGRPHIARVLVKKYPDKFSSTKDVFDKYIGIDKPAYVDREDRHSIKTAIEIIKKANGLAILAHPGMYKDDSAELIKIFSLLGGQCIETYYPYHIIFPDMKIDIEENEKLVKTYQKITHSLKLLESGGGDFHGGNRDTLGTMKIPDSVLEKLENKLTNEDL